MSKRASWVAFWAIVLAVLGLAELRAATVPSAAEGPSPAAPSKPKVTRFKENPIIRPDMMPPEIGENINGPSLIKVPDWIEKPLGKYYLYFSHHKGPHIRLAYADQLAGPWKIYEPGTLSMQEVAATRDYRINNKSHIASPDVHVNQQRKEIRMYFHAELLPYSRWGHRSGVAISKDGIHFTPQSRAIGEPYFRVFQYDGWYYTTTRTGNLARSRDGLSQWEERSDTYTIEGSKRALGVFAQATHDRENNAMMRHTAVLVDGDALLVYFTRTGDAPERVMLSTVKLTGDWTTWKLSPPVDVLLPDMEYEGSKFPAERSRPGSRLGPGPIRALQSPAIYREGGKTYLLYGVAGESGIAIAELTW